MGYPPALCLPLLHLLREELGAVGDLGLVEWEERVGERRRLPKPSPLYLAPLPPAQRKLARRPVG